MHIKHYTLLGVLGLSLCGCKDQQDDGVVSQRYIHKYGYAVSQQEWEAKSYPGQVITYLRNGITQTATYENDILHGPLTVTFPDSQIVAEYCLYNQGVKVKETLYSPMGMPISEEIRLSDERTSITAWYEDGVPMRIEEYLDEALVNGEYFTSTHEIENRILKGEGTRIIRDQKGVLLSTAPYENGYATKQETFYPNGTPESIAHYHVGTLNGEKKTFTSTGEPTAIEHYANDQLHGQSTYYKNGNKYLEVAYRFGHKHGVEKHFIDGDFIAQEIHWNSGFQHGPSIFYVEDKSKTEWFYAGKQVSKLQFDEFHELDTMISHQPPTEADFRR